MGARSVYGHGINDGTSVTGRDISMAKVIHTKTFSCADDHPIVWYTFDETNKALCGYCATQFVYAPEGKTTSEKMQEELEPISD